MMHTATSTSAHTIIHYSSVVTFNDWVVSIIIIKSDATQHASAQRTGQELVKLLFRASFASAVVSMGCWPKRILCTLHNCRACVPHLYGRESSESNRLCVAHIKCTMYVYADSAGQSMRSRRERRTIYNNIDYILAHPIIWTQLTAPIHLLSLFVRVGKCIRGVSPFSRHRFLQRQRIKHHKCHSQCVEWWIVARILATYI